MDITSAEFYTYIRKKYDPENLNEAKRLVKKEGGIALDEATPYYLEYFERIQINNRPIRWNWAAFLFNSYWLAYRKMYWEAAILGFACIFFSCLADFIDIWGWKNFQLPLIKHIAISIDIKGWTNIQLPVIGPITIMSLILNLLIGFAGNYLYYKDVVKRIKNNSSRKGTSDLAVWVSIIIFIAVSIGINKLLLPMFAHH